MHEFEQAFELGAKNTTVERLKPKPTPKAAKARTQRDDSACELARVYEVAVEAGLRRSPEVEEMLKKLIEDEEKQAPKPAKAKRPQVKRSQEKRPRGRPRKT